MGIRAGLDRLAASLTAAGVPTAVDPRNLNPPCAWVTGKTMSSPHFLCGSGLITADVYLIVPDSGTPTALDALDVLLDKALTVVTAEGDISLSESVALPTGAPLPAYKITTEIED